MSAQETDHIAACAEIVHKGDPARFRAAMAAPLGLREKLLVLYAFNVEVARAPWVTAEAMIAEMRLQWWREALEEIGAGGTVRRHEVVTPLARILDAEAAALLDLGIAARRWDIYKDPFEDAGHFDAYITRTSGHLLQVAQRVLGGTAPEVALDAGYAMGLANFLKAIPALEAAGRVPLINGRPKGIRALASDGLARLRRAQAARAQVACPAAPAFYAAWTAGPVLRRACARPDLVGQGALMPAPALARLRLMGVALTGRW